MTITTISRFYLPLLLSLLLAGGCQTLESKRSDIKLEKVLYSYDNTVRWLGIDRSYGFLKPELVAAEGIPDNLDNIRVTKYEVIQPPLPFGDNLVKQVVKISYVLQDRQIVRQVIDEQVWEYQKEDEVWYRINSMPDYQ